MQTQPFVIEGMNNVRRQSLYESASAALISDKPLQQAEQASGTSLAGRIGQWLMGVGTGSRPVSANAQPLVTR